MLFLFSVKHQAQQYPEAFVAVVKIDGEKLLQPLYPVEQSVFVYAESCRCPLYAALLYHIGLQRLKKAGVVLCVVFPYLQQHRVFHVRVLVFLYYAFYVRNCAVAAVGDRYASALGVVKGYHGLLQILRKVHEVLEGVAYPYVDIATREYLIQLRGKYVQRQMSTVDHQNYHARELKHIAV